MKHPADQRAAVVAAMIVQASLHAVDGCLGDLCSVGIIEKDSWI
jgi:SH3-like domain-containing protein